MRGASAHEKYAHREPAEYRGPIVDHLVDKERFVKNEVHLDRELWAVHGKGFVEQARAVEHLEDKIIQRRQAIHYWEGKVREAREKGASPSDVRVRETLVEHQKDMLKVLLSVYKKDGTSAPPLHCSRTP